MLLFVWVIKNMIKEKCANRIKKALINNDMSATELCKRTGIPKSAMSQYINGKFEPRQNRVYLIAKALNVSEAWLMGYDVTAERKDNKQEKKTLTENQKEIVSIFDRLTEEKQVKVIGYAEALLHEETNIPYKLVAFGGLQNEEHLPPIEEKTT